MESEKTAPEKLSTQPNQVTLPVIAEELAVSKRKLRTGRVRITKRVQVEEREVDEPEIREEVQVERVAVNRLVETEVPMRYEGNTLVIPVFEEVLVVEKRLMLIEEVRITRHRSEVHHPQRISLRREEALVEREQDNPEVP